uniref:Uncharacterized protein n=1 Tax=Lutzomyia longipalpis TaxID=7200 RepID=A0A1B0CL36_LUTLO
MKFFPRDDDMQYDVHVSENEIDSMPMSYTKNRLSTISVGYTIFILGQYLWRGYNAAIGYNGKSIFALSVAWNCCRDRVCLNGTPAVAAITSRQKDSLLWMVVPPKMIL